MQLLHPSNESKAFFPFGFTSAGHEGEMDNLNKCSFEWQIVTVTHIQQHTVTHMTEVTVTIRKERKMFSFFCYCCVDFLPVQDNFCISDGRSAVLTLLEVSIFMSGTVEKKKNNINN